MSRHHHSRRGGRGPTTLHGTLFFLGFIFLFPSIILVLGGVFPWGPIFLLMSVVLMAVAAYIWWRKDDPPETVGQVYTTYPQTGTREFRGAEMPSRYAYLEQLPKEPPGQAPPQY